MFCVLCSRFLPSYGGNQRQIVDCVVLGPLAPPSNQFIPCLALGFYFNNPCLLGEALSTQTGYLCSNFSFELYFSISLQSSGFHKGFLYNLNFAQSTSQHPFPVLFPYPHLNFITCILSLHPSRSLPFYLS